MSATALTTTPAMAGPPKDILVEAELGEGGAADEVVATGAEDKAVLAGTTGDDELSGIVNCGWKRMNGRVPGMKKDY
jgi:hypothetical protein